VIEQFEAVELKREEDLERVRLKNISLRANLKKLERTLRAKEQLAEGNEVVICLTVEAYCIWYE
jgi:hypothetical protein